MTLRRRFDEAARRWLPAILALLDDLPRTTTPAGSTLPGMCAYHLDTGGKRIRALLPLLTAEALGADPAPLVPFGAACEMLHNATLVHDDLQDGDLVRRGQPTVWRRFGAPQAVNLGDAMFYWTLLLLDRLPVDGALRARVAERVLLETLRVIDGQEREFALKSMEAPGVADYVRMVEGKTSGLFALPMAGGALLAGAPAPVVDALAEAARHLGVLFQVQDDVLDLYGDKGRGERGSDVGEGKRSILVVHALAHAPPMEAAWLRSVLDAPREETSPEDVARVADLLVSAGSLAHALEVVRARHAAAVGVVAEHPGLATLVGGLGDLFLEPIAGIGG